MAEFCHIFPACVDHKEFYINCLSLQQGAPLRVDIGLGPNIATQVVAILHGEQPADLAKESLEQFCNSMLSHLKADTGLNVMDSSGTGKVVISIPGSASTLTFEMRVARRLWASHGRG